MNTDELRRRLERIRSELQHVETVDSRERDILREIDREIDSLLTQPPTSQPQHAAQFRSRLEERIAEIEAAYPRATYMIGQAIEALAGIGL